MTTTVQGKLESGSNWLSVFSALFPCGSITGAPKLRTMEIIHQLENEPRGAYTGTIGHIAPNGSATFSVAIRTLQLRQHLSQWNVTLGVGGGIVADSDAAAEYAECLLKGDFARRAAKPIQLVETMRCDAGAVRFRDQHLQRMQHSARELGFPFDRDQLQTRIAEAVQQDGQGEAQQVRITLSVGGEMNVKLSRLQHWPQVLRVRIAEAQTALGDPTLHHKTSYRPSYDSELKAAHEAGFQESIFANDSGLITEGCITSVFLLRGQRLVTPRLECGALPGVLRSTVLEHDLADETLIPAAELDEASVLILGNSLRGFYPVQTLTLRNGQTVEFDTERAAELCAGLEKVFAPVPKP